MLKVCSIGSRRSLTPLQRVLLPLAVVFAVLATAGWIGHGEVAAPGLYEAELRAWERAEAAGRSLPDAEAGPGEVAAFFDGLGTQQRLRLAERFPLVVGNLPGAPVQLRYRANRHALVRARDTARARMHDERLSATGQYMAGRRMHRFDSMLDEGRQILAFDPTGRGRAAEVFGDLEQAERVSLVVPGVDTELLTFERTRLKYTAPAGMAEALYERQRTLAPGVRTAVIAWADYEAPPGMAMSAATGELASGGAQRLVRSVQALPRDASVALFCHSYGSVVCGMAAGDLPARVTDLAVAGSPGMRASDVDDLHTRARVWAMRAEDDWIQDVPHLEIGPLGHGSDPVGPGFGARLLSTGKATGHGSYFEPGSGSLKNFARIGTGAVNSVRCAPGAEGCAPLDPCAVPE